MTGGCKEQEEGEVDSPQGEGWKERDEKMERKKKKRDRNQVAGG